MRAGLDARAETIGAKIRDATMEKVPYMLVVGAKEEESSSVSVRARTGGDLGSSTLAEFIARAQSEVAARRTHTEEKTST
jgi:threonyl-tRNA synthetase